MAVETPICDFGAAAIDFALSGVGPNGADERTWTLQECRGENGLLVMFICNHCPYVQAVIDRIVRDTRDLAALGIGSVAISANDAQQYPEDSFDNMRRLAAAKGFGFPYLYDESQQVARAYGAVCTPDFFGYNRDLGLQYRGRLDASRRETAPEGTPRELFDAMRQVAETGQGPAEQVASMGCSIKWRE